MPNETIKQIKQLLFSSLFLNSTEANNLLTQLSNLPLELQEKALETLKNSQSNQTKLIQNLQNQNKNFIPEFKETIKTNLKQTQTSIEQSEKLNAAQILDQNN